MKNIRPLFVTVLCLLIPYFVSSQSSKLYTTAENLSSSLINNLIQDNSGFIWIATEYGLNRFDGYKFSVYKHNSKAGASTIIDNYVKAIFEDSKKQIWIGFINGLMKYDPHTNTFKKIAITQDKNIVEPYVTSIIETKRGEIWFSTSGYGVYKIVEINGEFKAISQLKNKLSSDYINAIYEDINSNLWFANGRDGLNRYTPSSGVITSFHVKDGLTTENVTSIAGNKKGFIFIGSERSGISVYNPSEKRIFDVPHSKQLLLQCLYVNNDNELLIGTDGLGLKVYDMAKNTIENYKAGFIFMDISNTKIHAITKDKQGNLWLGVYQKGILVIPNAQKGFKYIGVKSSLQNNPIGNSPISAICKDHTNTLWIGTDNDGIYGLDQNLKQTAHFKQSTAPNSIPNIIFTIFEDSNNQLWIGSFTKGLGKLNRKTGTCSFLPELINEKVYSITEDKEKKLIVGTSGSGVYLVDLSVEKGKVTNLRSSKNKKSNLTQNELPNNWINDVLVDKEGMIWIGHYKGLTCYNPHKRTFINNKKNNLIPETVILSLYEDSKGNIYAGSKDGLFYFDKKTLKLSKYSTQNGLSDDAVCAITGDAANLWISTYKGINKLNLRTKEISNFFVGDGLQGNEFLRGSVFRDKDGTIYFGGINGITYFKPNKTSKIFTKNNQLYITDFYLNNIPIEKGSKSGGKAIIHDAVINSDKFTLSYLDNTFSFDLSTFNYSNSRQTSYQYRIQGINDNWTALPYGMNRIAYTNLAHGKYKIELRALLSNKVYTETKIITIVITPPWHQTWWSYIIYTSILVFIVAGVINYIMSRNKFQNEISEQKQMKKISEEKLQFFTNIAHEIRTPMTLVISPIEKLIAEGDSKHEKTYLLIYKNAQRILHLVNQIMDIRKLDKGQIELSFTQTNIVDYIKNMMESFAFDCSKKNIRFTFNHSHEALNVWIDPNIFDKILLNVLSNAFKFTPENGEIDINLTTGKIASIGEFFEITISDTGIGINEEEIEKIFERFYQVNNKFSNIGTGIGLHLSRAMVELCKGDIHAKNRSDKQGCNFIIRLPLGKDHINKGQIRTDKQSKSSINKEMVSLFIQDTGNQDISREEGDFSKSVVSKVKFSVLVVDDDDQIRSYLKEEFSKDFEVFACKNGKEGLEYTLKNKPDAILCDIIMPEMDGITMTKKIKTNINVNHIPVIFFSAKHAIQDKLDALKTEADAYFEKPFNLELLKYTINNLIKNRKKMQNKYSGNEIPAQLIQPIEAKSSDTILIERIMKVINKHLNDPRLSVQMLSDEVGISRGHLHRKLKELTNQSAQIFIRDIRLKQAADLLTKQELSISEVVYATGFSSQSYFSNTFKSYYGISPSEYVDWFKKKTDLNTD